MEGLRQEVSEIQRESGKTGLGNPRILNTVHKTTFPELIHSGDSRPNNFKRGHQESLNIQVPKFEGIPLVDF